MVMPVLVLPFVTMLFWSLGGGKTSQSEDQLIENTGLNLELPGPHFNNEEINKLSLYEKAERDSLKLEEERKNDPYFDLALIVEQDTQPEKATPQARTMVMPSTTLAKTATGIDPNEARVNQKLEQLYRELNKAQTQPETTADEQIMPVSTDPQFSSDVKQLEQMMEMMNKGNEPDPEMENIDNVLDKIPDIQHPQRVHERAKLESIQNKDKVFPFEPLKAEDNIALIANDPQPDSSNLLSKIFPVQSKRNSFYGLNDEVAEGQETENAIEAVIHDTQELVAGSTVKMRLLDDAFVNGNHIPSGHFVHGTCEINGERLTIKVNSIRSDNSVFPVSLSAFDLDGIEGVYIPGAIARDVVKQSSDQGLQGMQFLSMDQSLSAQAANVGIQAAKGLFSKKVKQVKVTVKAGYKVLLKDDK
jgi:conjugative transposon TraM protein